jgi:hypothetical protein
MGPVRHRRAHPTLQDQLIVDEKKKNPGVSGRGEARQYGGDP